MEKAAKELDFMAAAKMRDTIKRFQKELEVLKKVKHLNLGRNYLHPDSAKALADTKTLVNVETLLMIENYLGDDGVKNIMESDSFIKLKTFRVL